MNTLGNVEEKRLFWLIIFIMSLNIFWVQDVMARETYGAIAYSIDSRIAAWTKDYASKDEADTEAYRACEKAVEERCRKLEAADSFGGAIGRAMGSGPTKSREPARCERETCGVVLLFRNSCGALAEGTKGWGTGWSPYPDEVQQEALRNCGKCNLKTPVVCSTPDRNSGAVLRQEKHRWYPERID